MAKKSILSGLFPFLVAIASLFLGAVFFVAKTIVGLLGRIAVFSAEKAKENSEDSKKPKALPKYAEFEIAKTAAGKFEDFEKYLFGSKSSIGLILGARGSGKSALGMRILENAATKTGKTLCTIGFLPESLPSWIKCISTVKEIPNNSFVLIDEGGVLFSSRNSMSSANRVLSEIILIARHKDISVLFISQNSSNLEVNTIRQADYLMLRKSSLLQKDFERKKIKEVYAEAEKFEEFSKAGSRLTYVYSDYYKGYAENELPNFWSEKTSKAFR